MDQENRPICHANFNYEKCDRMQMFGCTFCDLNPNKEEWFPKEKEEQLKMDFYENTKNCTEKF